MSKIKFSNDLFIGNIELTRLQQFLSEDGFRKLLGLQVESYGILRDKTELVGGALVSDNFKIIEGTTAGSVKLAQDSYAIDSDMNLILQKAFNNLAITAGSWYYLMVSYAETTLEEGYVSVNSQGQLTGDANTKFLTTLRGMPDFPSKIRFTDDINGIGFAGEYEVLSVLDDANAILQGDFSALTYTNVRYELIGTFTPGYVVQSDNKGPLKYDSCSLSLVAGDDPLGDKPDRNSEPEAIYFPAVPTEDKYFYVAAAYNSAGNVEIVDLRHFYRFKTFSEKEAESFVQCDRTTGFLSGFYNFKLGTLHSFTHSTGVLTLNNDGNIFIVNVTSQAVVKSIEGPEENSIIYLKITSDDGYVQIADPASGGKFLNFPARYYTSLAEGIWTVLRKTANTGEWEFIAYDEFISDEILSLAARVTVLETAWGIITSANILPYIKFDSGWLAGFDSVVSSNYYWKVEKNILFLNFDASFSVEDPGTIEALYLRIPNSLKVATGKTFKTFFHFKTFGTSAASAVSTVLEASAVGGADHIILRPITRFSGSSPAVVTQGTLTDIGIATVPYTNIISGQMFFEFTV